MFADQLTQAGMTRLGWYVGWERYSWATAAIIGIATAAAVAQLRLTSEAASSWTMISGTPSSATAVHGSDDMHYIAQLMLIVAGS